MRTASTLVALAALSVGQTLAGPAHAHRHAHAKKDVANADLSKVDWNAIDWNKVGVQWDKVDYSNSDAATPSADADQSAPTTLGSSSAAPSSSDAAVVVPSSSAAASPSSSSVMSATPSKTPKTSPNSNGFTGLFDGLWEGLEGCSNSRNSFGSRTASSGSYVGYQANVGSPYGSNIMLVDDVGDHTYTVKVVNTSPESMTINVWNKNGKDGQLNNGATDAPKFTTLTFNLSPGQDAIFACDENTVLSFCEAVDRFHFSGAFATTWAEVKFKDKDSGYDVSKILNDGPEYKMKMYAEGMSCISSDTENNWITESDTTGSGSCYQPNEGLHLTVEMGGCA